MIQTKTEEDVFKKDAEQMPQKKRTMLSCFGLVTVATSEIDTLSK